MDSNSFGSGCANSLIILAVVKFLCYNYRIIVCFYVVLGLSAQSARSFLGLTGPRLTVSPHGAGIAA